ncbi:hypothetical protein FN846DRAFT_936329 [Sphaerosporella brunnea]|uniref:Uncharacterized protein n=1 Tax=Sphaerosporella brunnea TaxID=1250544 RepID=A0A5J5F560_9PEZI|nr:hypothetical protein FN846DRAFT_936329 [Sphaerosporella brunnea]
MPSPPPPKERKVRPAANLDAVKNQGAFHARVPPSAPSQQEQDWHKPGKKQHPADRAPQFHCQKLPPGSAPPEHTYYPRTYMPPPPEEYVAESPVGIEDMPGPTSKDLNKPFLRPVYGQTSEELHHDGRPKRKKEDVGLAKYGHSEVHQPEIRPGEAPEKFNPQHVYQGGKEKQHSRVEKFQQEGI